MDYNSYLAAIAAESKEQVKELRCSSQRVYDPDKKRHGIIERYDPVEHEVCDVEIVGTDVVVINVPLLKLKPHSAFRIRAGHRIQVNGWIGIVNKIERKVVIKCTNGTKLKFYVDEESTGNFDSYMSNGKLPTWWDRITPESPDLFSTIDEIPYPGNRISLTDVMERSSRDSSCFWDMKNFYFQLGGMFRARELGEEADIVKKVKIKSVEVEWETRMIDASFYTPSTNVVISSAEVLAPLNQEYCEEGSCRIYELTGEEIIMPKTMWMNEKVLVEGAPRNLTVDEVDKSEDGKKWLHRNGHHHRFVENGVVVKIVTKKRFVGIRWEDGSLETVSVPEAMNLKMDTSASDEDLYEISLDTDNESVEKVPLNSACASPRKGYEVTNKTDEIIIPWLNLHFKRKDLVVDALREYPSQETVYGVVKAINHSDLTAVVDWYEVDECHRTNPKEVQAVSSIFDLVHIDEVLDQSFRITWKVRSKSYGSEIVCSRIGKTLSGFRAGYLREISESGQIIANSDSSVWTLWPSEIERMNIVAHQTEEGDWTHCSNGFTTDTLLIKNFLPDYRIQQVRLQQNQACSSEAATESKKFDNIDNFPRLRKLKYAPACHKYYESTDTQSGSSANLYDPTVMAALVSHELKKTLLQMESAFIYFCVFEDRPELASALMLGKPGSVYEGAVFIFDICFPVEFPSAFPKVNYICYATKLSPALEDAYISGPIRPLKCLNTTEDEINFSKPASLISLNGSYELYTEDDGQGDSNSCNFRKTYHLTDFMKYVYGTLFTTRPEDLVAELYPGCISEDQPLVYNEFLTGKKIEALANLITYPYPPWEDFMQLLRPNINMLLENVQGLFLNRELGISSKEAQSFGYGFSNHESCDGLLLFLKRRVQYLLKALEVGATDPDHNVHVPIINIITDEHAENSGKKVDEHLEENEENFCITGQKPCPTSFLSNYSFSGGRLSVPMVEVQNLVDLDSHDVLPASDVTFQIGHSTDASSDSASLEQRLERLVFDESNLSCKEDVDGEAEDNNSNDKDALNLSSTRL